MGNAEERNVSYVLALPVASVSSTEILGEAFWLLHRCLLGCTRKGASAIFLQKEEENLSGEQGNEGEMAAFSYRAAQGFTHSCVEAGWAHAKTKGHSALEDPPTSYRQLQGCTVLPVWAATHSKRGIGPARRAHEHPCDRLWFWEGAGGVTVSKDSLWVRFCTGSLLDDTYTQLFLSLARCPYTGRKQENEQANTVYEPES